LIFGEVLFWGTPLFQFWPWHQLVKESVLAGEWPLWNPLLGNGTPLLANLQSALFYPPNLLYLLLPVAQAMTLSVILHLSLAGGLMFGYARQLKLSPFAATVAALTYMFSGYVVGRTQFGPMINALAWFPLLLWLTERLAVRRDKRLVLGLGLVLALQLLAGHAQLWFYGLCLIGAYLMVRVWQESAPKRVADWPRLLPNLLCRGFWLATAVGLALLLAAVQLLPTAEFIGQSPRDSGAERAFALTYSFWPWRLLTLLAPTFFGHPAQADYWGYANFWEDHAYLGSLPFLLALFAIGLYFQPKISWPFQGKQATNNHHEYQIQNPKSKIQNRVVPFFTLLIPLSLILAMGWNTPIYLWVFDTIPGFGYFQAPSRLLIWYTLAMAVLAGIGAETFRLTPGRVWWLRLLLAASLGMALISQIVGLLLAGVTLTFLMAITQTGLWVAGSIGLLLLRPGQAEADPGPQPSRRPGWWQGVVIIFIGLDLLWQASLLNPLIPVRLFEQPIRSAEFLQTQPGDYRTLLTDDFDYRLKFNQYFRFKQFGPLSVDHWQNFRETLSPNGGVFAHLPSANNDDPLVVARWQQLMTALERASPNQQARLLGLMHVGYLISDPTAPALGRVIYQTEAVTIQQVPEPLPRAYFVGQASPAPNEAAVLARLLAPDFDSRREVIIMAESAQLPSPGSPLVVASPPVWLTEAGPNQLHLSLKAPGPGWVVITDTFYPGWQATVNGRPVTIWPANLAFRALPVQAGLQEIVLRYQPLSFRIGLWLSGAGLLLIILLHLILTRSDS
jgi:hypothetical protein